MVTVARITEKEQQVIQSEGSKPLPEIVLALSQVIHTHFLLLGREERSEEKQRVMLQLESVIAHVGVKSTYKRAITTVLISN